MVKIKPAFISSLSILFLSLFVEICHHDMQYKFSNTKPKHNEFLCQNRNSRLTRPVTNHGMYFHFYRCFLLVFEKFSFCNILDAISWHSYSWWVVWKQMTYLGHLPSKVFEYPWRSLEQSAAKPLPLPAAFWLHLSLQCRPCLNRNDWKLDTITLKSSLTWNCLETLMKILEDQQFQMVEYNDD